jgi:hypothetical protein
VLIVSILELQRLRASTNVICVKERPLVAFRLWHLLNLLGREPVLVMFLVPATCRLISFGPEIPTSY